MYSRFDDNKNIPNMQWFTVYDKQDFLIWEQFGIEWLWSAELLFKKVELSKTLHKKHSETPESRSSILRESSSGVTYGLK